VPGAPGQEFDAAVRAASAAALKGGAAGLIVTVDAAFGADRMSAVSAAARVGRGAAARLPVFLLRGDVAAQLFSQAGLDAAALARDGAASTFRPVPLPGVSARGGVSINEVEHTPPNVVALLEGSDPTLKNTYVVFSAHMDHVGVGRPDARGDSIYNGADDDASGTAAVLEIAEAFASMPARPARSLLFLTVSGEEKGLLGSAWFADHPTVPVQQIVANINIDMIGRNWQDSVVAIGQAFSSLGATTQEIARNHPELRMTVLDDIWPEERFFFRSDHFNFARKEIPAIFFFSGVHEDYHRPSDHVDKIDTEKTARIAKLIFHLGHAIATSPQPPQWTEDGLRQVRELTTRR
jgi:Zn-dependent M28 family amino/carboxypeptidase